MEQFVRKRIIGIAFGEQEISVCAHFQDQIAEVLRLPAVFTVSPVGEVLTGNRAVRYAEICHSSRSATALQAQPQSIYRYLDQHAWNPEAVFSWKGMRITVREILNGLLQDLKQELSVTVYGNCDTCVLAVPSMDLRVQAAVSQAVETAGFSVIRVLDFALAGALRFAKDWSKEGYFLSIMSDAEHVAAALVEYGGGVVELLSAAERMHSGDAGSVLSGLLWEMKQALGPAMASGRLYEDEALLQMPLRAFPGLCMASRQSGLLQAAGLGEAVNYAEHPERTAAIGAAMQGGKLDGWAEMEDTLLLECLPCALHLEPEGTGHVIIPEQTTIPTRSKKRARCRVAEMGSDSRITVSMGQELSRYAGCEEGQTAALRSWKISELQTPFAGYPAELELELMVGLDIRAAGSGLQVTNRETGESYLFSFTDLYQKPWQRNGSEGSQTVNRTMALTHMAHAVKRLRENTAHLAMPVSDQSGNSWDWATTMRTSRVQAEQEAAVLKGLQQVLKQSEAFLQKQVLQHYVGGATTSHPEELVPEALAAVTERGLAPTAAIAEEMLTILDSLEYGLRGISDPVSGAERIMGGYYSVLLRVLKQYLNVTPVEALAMPFDVDRHYALMQETVPGITDGIVTEELQRGYLLSGQLLRAAKVKVSC